MPRARRLRRAARWSGLVACALIAAAWAASIWWTLSWLGFRGTKQLIFNRVSLDRGCLLVFHADLKGPRHLLPPRGWSAQRNAEPGIVWSPHWMLEGDLAATHAWQIGVPLYIPLVALALPTVWLWYHDRRARPGLCPCGYSLAGLAPAAPCPECGRTSNRGPSLPARPPPHVQ